MWSSWWFFWVFFMLLFLLPPVGYGWGYRRWGAPYPRYVQRRRSERAGQAGTVSTFNHQSWGWAGDYVWGMTIIWAIWLLIALFWWR